VGLALLTAGAGGAAWALRRRGGTTAEPPPPGRMISLAGEAIHYLDEGSGRPIVLLHGLGGSTASWRLLMPLLADRYRVVALDFPGYGHSTRAPAWPMSHEHQARRVLRLLDELGLQRVTLVGLSMGGAIAQRIAVRDPERVEALVLIASVDASEPPDTRVRHGMRRLGLTSPAMVAAVVPVLGSRRMTRAVVRTSLRRAVADPRAVTREWVDIHATPLTVPGTWPVLARMVTDMASDEALDLSQIVQPVLVVSGDVDSILPADVSGAIAAAIPGARLVRLKGVGHLPPLERPATVAREISAFVDSI
jgi:pimeloyl-ACP methyl ester carboxylesterase